MIAGEYAVLEKKHTLVAMAVDRFVFATITESTSQVLDLENLELRDVSWEFRESTVKLGLENKKLSFVRQAMEVTLSYLKEQQIDIRPFSLSIRSELDDATGVKYGLGSSAAVTTAVVSAILHMHFRAEPAKDLLFRLAIIAHVRTQGTGSGADIAASVYGGMIEYTSPQADWLLDADARTSTVTDLVELTWPYATIEPIVLPTDVHVYVGWTGTPASTVRLVDQILKEENKQTFDYFLANSETSVQLFLRGMKDSDIHKVFEGIEANRQALADLGIATGVPIETPLLKILSEDVRALGGAGKLSGAGGGDCGIAFLPSTHERDALFSRWKQSNIHPLHIQLTTEGAMKV